jgi:hypothetical protein
MRPFLFVALIAMIQGWTPAAMAGALAAYESYADGEQDGYFWSVKSKLSTAKEMAQRACIEAGDENRDCSLAEYCSPSQWAAIVEMKRTNGSMVATLVCERPSRPSIFVAVRKKCSAYRAQKPGQFKQCNIVSIISPDGKERPNATRYRWIDGGLQAD